MTARGRSHVPTASASNARLRGEMGTSRTLPNEGGMASAGTDPREAYGYDYIPVPPKAELPKNEPSMSWTGERIFALIAGAFSIVAVVVAGIVFFYGMGRDISDIKSDVKDGNNKISNLSEKVDKNSFDLQSTANAIQNIQGEIHGALSSRK